MGSCTTCIDVFRVLCWLFLNIFPCTLLIIKLYKLYKCKAVSMVYHCVLCVLCFVYTCLCFICTNLQTHNRPALTAYQRLHSSLFICYLSQKRILESAQKFQTRRLIYRILPRAGTGLHQSRFESMLNWSGWW